MRAPRPSAADLKRALKPPAPADAIYLDWNASTPLRPEAFAAMRPYLEGSGQQFGNAASVHRHGQAARTGLERARRTCALVLGCTPDEIVFTSGGTESNNLALRGLAWALRLESQKRNLPPPKLLSSGIEHSAVLETLRSLETQGFPLVCLKAQSDGTIDLGAFQEAAQRAAREGRALVTALMQANNETGAVQPVAELAEALRAVPNLKAVLHVDAVQAAGKLPINVNELGCDTLALSAHKFEGPKGAGLLYVRAGANLAPHLTGGGHEAGLRGGTPHVAGAVGLAEALRLAETERSQTAAYETRLRDLFEKSFCERVPGAVVLSAGVPRLPNTSFVAFPKGEAEEWVIALDLAGVMASTGAACIQGTSRRSHVLEAMDLPEATIRGAVRFSLGRLTTEAEILEAVGRIAKVVKHGEDQ